MKNTVSINTNGKFECECVDIVNDGTNRLFINVITGNSVQSLLIYSNDTLLSTVSNLTANSENLVLILSDYYIAGSVLKVVYGSNSLIFNFPSVILGNMSIEKTADYTYSVKYTNVASAVRINPTAIPKGTDFNTLIIPSIYVSSVKLGDGTNANYGNAPSVIATDFLLEVLPTGDAGQFLQRLTYCSKGYGRTFERHYHSNAFGDWFCTSADRNTVLWSGAELMESRDKVITLTENISKQPTGIALLFSRAENGAPVDYHFVTEFISKNEVLAYNGKGHGFSLFKHSPPFSAAGSKYLYVYNDRIEGNTNNALAGTSDCGITYDNSLWYLRRVIGV